MNIFSGKHLLDNTLRISKDPSEILEETGRGEQSIQAAELAINF